jgi:hypothetical protein
LPSADQVPGHLFLSRISRYTRTLGQSTKKNFSFVDLKGLVKSGTPD